MYFSLSRYAPDLKGYNRSKFSKDIMASLVVFLVAVPLGLGIALASGAPLISGIIACAVGGIVAGLLSGAPLQVSGPAAGLTLLTYGVIQQFGWQLALSVFITAGIVQIALGLVGVGRSCLMISPAVVKGMLAGIGVVIVLAQLHIMLGSDPESSAINNLMQLPSQIIGMNSHATLTGLLTLGILIGWEFLPGKIRAVPGALVSILIATLITTFLWTDVKRISLPEQLLVFQFPAVPSGDIIVPFFIAVLSVAIVASVESLLCAVATDKLHDGARSRLNQELVAQGAANIFSGGLGGLPVTGVIVRSSANISAGAVSRVSALFHGLWIIVFIAVMAPLVNLIPLPALAGLLVYVGARLVNLQHIRELKSHREELIYGITVLGVVTLGLLQGVCAGIILAFILLFRRLSKVDIVLTENEDVVSVRVDGALTFLNVPRLTSALGSVSPGKIVDMDLAMNFMDHAGFEALHSWKKSYELSGGTVYIEELHESWYAKAAEGQPIVVPENKGRYALASVLGNKIENELHDPCSGVIRFRRSLGEALRPLYSQLANGQNPQILFITCCDSRVDPGLIMAAQPGELFVVRNIGNMIHARNMTAGDNGTPADCSVPASLDYAVEILNVKHIVVCGHSDCGAMKAILSGAHKSYDSLDKWLGESERQLPDSFCHAHNDKAENQVSRWNVAEQLKHLQTYPNVAERIAAGSLQIHGWYFEIESAEVQCYDSNEKRWQKLDWRMSSSIRSARQSESDTAA